MLCYNNTTYLKNLQKDFFYFVSVCKSTIHWYKNLTLKKWCPLQEIEELQNWTVVMDAQLDTFTQKQLTMHLSLWVSLSIIYTTIKLFKNMPMLHKVRCFRFWMFRFKLTLKALIFPILPMYLFMALWDNTIFLWSRVSQIWHCYHLGPDDSLLWGAVLYIMGYLARSLASNH